jgi:hypothetical protein
MKLRAETLQKIAKSKERKDRFLKKMRRYHPAGGNHAQTHVVDRFVSSEFSERRNRCECSGSRGSSSSG